MAKTLKSVIDEADAVKPNAFSSELKTEWINALEGHVQVDVWLRSPAEITQYTWTDNQSTELLVSSPHDAIYGLWLQAQIDFHNGEYNKYQNTMQAFNAAWDNYSAWFAQTYEPACGYNTDLGRTVIDGT